MKLKDAEAAIAVMRLAADRGTFEAGWSDYVDALQEFWVRFYQEGSAISTAFQPWAGRIDRVRRIDPLLQYLHQARHQSQHGKLHLDWSSPRLVIGRGFVGRLYGLRTFGDGTYEAAAQPLGQPDQSFPVEYEPGDARLPSIENKKYRQYYSPPAEYLGAPITDASPINVALAALAYYHKVLADARSKFGDAGGDA